MPASILILGGSNAGLTFGWAAQLKSLTPAALIDNCFLGGSGSLYGLFHLLKIREYGGYLPDLILFEYTLNDIVFFEANQLKADLIEATLTEILSLCANLKIPIIFLGIAPRPKHRLFIFNDPSRVVKKIYKQILSDFNSEIFIDLNSKLKLSYLDDHHLTEASSKNVADFLLDFITRRKITAPYRTNNSSFKFVLPGDAIFQENTTLKEISSPVYNGEFLEIRRGGSASFLQEGRLVGILIRSTAKSGLYTISTTGIKIKKSAQSTMREIVPNLILMHNLPSPLYSHDRIEIAMPREEEDLTDLPEDHSLLVCASSAHYQDQTLECGALLFWTSAREEKSRSLLKKAKSQLISLLNQTRIIKDYFHRYNNRA